MKKIVILLAVGIVSLTFTSCGIYKKYSSPSEISSNAFGTSEEVTAAQSDNSIAELSWREFFTDPLLQQLIDTALAHNTDVQSARINVEKAEAALKAAKLAYYPSITFAPSASVSGAVGSNGASPAAWVYNVPLQLDWNIGFAGSVTVNKRKANAVLLQAEAQREVVQSNIISMVAQQYSLLQILDRQLEILLSTDSLWDKSLETQQVLWENGKSYSTAVSQMESSNLSVKTQIVDVRRNIRQVEVLQEAYTGTHELMDNGKASYLEVLTAQETLLSAQLNEAMNLYNASQAIIALYIALGGGAK